jgi:hypothetical protein
VVVKTLPSDAWHETNNGSSAGFQMLVSLIENSTVTMFIMVVSLFKHLSRPLEASDWERFDLYAKRMKYIELTDHDRIDVCVFRGFAQAIRNRHHARPLLESLRQIRCRPAARTMGSTALFLGPKLTHFTMFTSDQEVALKALSICSLLKAHCPYLKHLEMVGRYKEMLLLVLSDLVGALHHLRAFIADSIPLPWNCIICLGGLSDLWQFNARIIKRDCLASQTIVLAENTFPALRQLYLNVDLLPVASKFLATFVQCSPI